MKIEIRLKKLLQDHGLDYFGVSSDIAGYCQVDRQTVGRLYRNQTNTVSLELLAKICDWLEQQKNFSSEILPQSLFGRRPSRLWEAVAAVGKTTIYLGEYTQSHDPDPVWKWVGGGDAFVESLIIRSLSGIGTARLKLQTEYIPIKLGADSPTGRTLDPQDITNTQLTFEAMQTKLPENSAILVGSQTVNLLVEHLVSHLFGCKAFQQTKTLGSKVPFYMLFRDPSHAVRSCFGGLKRPSGYRKNKLPGIYFRNKNNQWSLMKWDQNREFPGIVITAYEPGTKGMILVVFGFTGLATELLGAHLVGDAADRFWATTAASRGRQIGVYICCVRCSPNLAHDRAPNLARTSLDIVALDKEILEKYLR